MNRITVGILATFLALGGCDFTDDYRQSSSFDSYICHNVPDEYGVGEPCMSPGSCGEGTLECDGPFTVRCSSGPGGSESRVTVELCDGEDNDCDAAIDNGCECRHGATRWCRSGEGACESGRQSCEEGYWGACLPNQSSEPEICDGVDNDCDGEVDNGFDLDMPCPSMGVCQQVRVCSEDHETSLCIDDPRSISEERCDGIDNDCDGLVDRIVEDGVIQSVCSCRPDILAIGEASDASFDDDLNLCAPTTCGADRPRKVLIDATCYPVCLGPDTSPPIGDSFGYENNQSCILEDSPRGRTATPCPTDPLPTGMSMSYCLDCLAVEEEGDLPYAMCESVPLLDLSAFGSGEKWLRVDYEYTATRPAKVPVNLWLHSREERRKRLPLVKVGDLPGRDEAFVRIEDACFTASSRFGRTCPGNGETCAHCGKSEVCGALAECGNYDFRQTRIQVAAEFCTRGDGEQLGKVTLHAVELVEPNCEE